MLLLFKFYPLRVNPLPHLFQNEFVLVWSNHLGLVYLSLRMRLFQYSLLLQLQFEPLTPEIEKHKRLATLKLLLKQVKKKKPSSTQRPPPSDSDLLVRSIRRGKIIKRPIPKTSTPRPSRPTPSSTPSKKSPPRKCL